MCQSDHPPPSIYIKPSFLGGGDQDLSQGVVVKEIAEVLQFCESSADFAAVFEGYSSDLVEEAIALQPDQPLRKQLSDWYAAEASATQRKLGDYQPGQEAWAFFPNSEAKWLKATVEWVRDGMVRVNSGLLGMLIDREEAIAPGNWVMRS